MKRYVLFAPAVLSCLSTAVCYQTYEEIMASVGE